MVTNAKPSQDPADNDSFVGTLGTVLRKFLQGVDDMLPARVVSYDRATNRASVQPVVSMLTTAGAQVSRATIGSVPVLMIGGGGQSLSFNLNVGDLGWLKASDRDISLFLQSFGVGGPNTHRMHSFEDALFIPDALRNVTIAGEDESCAVLQSNDGDLRVSVGAGRVKLTAGANSVTVSAAGVAIIGTLTINGAPYLAHQHTGVTTGTGTSGGVA